MPASRGQQDAPVSSQPSETGSLPQQTQQKPANHGERRALLESGAVTLAFAIGAILWGFLSESRVIIFDGVYTALGLLLTAMSMRVSRVVAHGPTDRYPFGRSALMPMAIVVQGAALAGVLAYAAVDAVLVILDGGTPINTGNIVAYGVVAALVSLAIAWRIGRVAPRSDLAKAEVMHWHSGAVLSAVIAIGALAGLVAIQLDYTNIIDYVDPSLVLLSCIVLIPVPWRMISGSLAELLEAKASRDVVAAIDAAVAQVSADRELTVTHVRSTKLGPRLSVDVDAMVLPGAWDVSDVDDYREELTAALQSLGFDVWAGIEVTTRTPAEGK